MIFASILAHQFCAVATLPVVVAATLPVAVTARLPSPQTVGAEWAMEALFVEIGHREAAARRRATVVIPLIIVPMDASLDHA